MKPLELTVHRSFQDRQGSDWYVWGDTCVRPWIADSYSEMKRLTNAELAAEFYKSTSDHYAANSMHLMFEDADTEKALSDSRDWMFAMERFATLPHYDEEPTP